MKHSPESFFVKVHKIFGCYQCKIVKGRGDYGRVPAGNKRAGITGYCWRLDLYQEVVENFR